MKSKNCLKLALFASLILGYSTALTSCGNSANEFEFVGKQTWGEGETANDYTIRVIGSKDEDGADSEGVTEGDFELTIDELPALELDGTWKLIPKKGYKLYFDDYDEDYEYTKYDTETKQFSFSYNLNLGGGYGAEKVKFTYTDSSFAKNYDGKGLGLKPPTFTGGGYGSTDGTTWRSCTVTCYEDNTCKAVCPYKSRTRGGTWTYDETNNQYSFNFDVETYTYLRAGKGEYKGCLGNSYGNYEDPDKKYIRHIYCDPSQYFFTADEYKNTLDENNPGKHYNRVEWWEASGTQADYSRDYSTSTWNGLSGTHENEIEFKTEYNEDTKTYRLVYEQIDGFYYVDRIVNYTLED